MLTLLIISLLGGIAISLFALKVAYGNKPHAQEALSFAFGYLILLILSFFAFVNWDHIHEQGTAHCHDEQMKHVECEYDE